MKKALKHWKTITRHRHEVIRLCARAGILRQGLLHDLSKYGLSEFLAGARYYTDGRRSPNETERGVNGYSAAWMHHKGRNRHHYEYWSDYNPQTKLLQPVEMPLRYVIEMFCDRIAASKVYQGENYNCSQPLEYFLRVKGRRSIDPNTAVLLEQWLTMLSEEGEEKTLRYIKEYHKKTKRGVTP